MRRAPFVAIAAMLVALLIFTYLSTPSTSKAPSFSLTDVDGNVVSLSNLSGKIVILEFMATWCSPCKRQVDELKPIFDAHEELVVVLSVSVDPNDTDDVLRLYREELGIEWVVAGDKNGVSKRYQVTSIPTLFIIDQQGVIRAKYVGVTSYETLLNTVGQLLG